MSSAYSTSSRSSRDYGGIVAMLPRQEVKSVDQWGVAAGMTSRTGAVRELLKRVWRRRSTWSPDQVGAGLTTDRMCASLVMSLTENDSMRARIGRQEKVGRLALRVPSDVYDYVAEHARQCNRSINYEVMLRLQATVELDRIFLTADPAEKLAALERLKQRMIGLRLSASEED